jgi:hypothetical protein
MTHLDIDFLMNALHKGLVRSPCLELGAGLEGHNCKQLLMQHSINYYGTDMVEGPDVDFVIDFEQSAEEIAKRVESVGQFNSVLVFNVLEHTFNPIQVLDNVMGLVAAGGTCLISTPSVFCLHDYPIDCWRIMPAFYLEYARRKHFEVVEGSLEFLGYGSVTQFKHGNQVQFPRPYNGSWKDSYSSFVHKVFTDPRLMS